MQYVNNQEVKQTDLFDIRKAIAKAKEDEKKQQSKLQTDFDPRARFVPATTEGLAITAAAAAAVDVAKNKGNLGAIPEKTKQQS